VKVSEGDAVVVTPKMKVSERDAVVGGKKESDFLRGFPANIEEGTTPPRADCGAGGGSGVVSFTYQIVTNKTYLFQDR
jgi:hypothetical protein